MTTKVQAQRLLSKNLLQAVGCALSFRDVNLNLGSSNAVLDLYELLSKVELWKGDELVYRVLEKQWRCEQKSEMQLFLKHLEHVDYLLKLCLVLLEYADLLVDLFYFLTVLFGEVSLESNAEYLNLCFVFDNFVLNPAS